MDNRKHMGKNKEEVIFWIAPNLSEMGEYYLKLYRKIICLYWNIGWAILAKQEQEGWGAKVIDCMSKDLKDAFLKMCGFSPRNIKYMRKFAQCWQDYEIVQRVVAQIPWRTNRMLLDKLDNEESRVWYANKTIETAGIVLF